MPVANVRFTKARKRDGRMVAIDQGRIMNAVRHATEASAEGNVARDPKLVADAAMTALDTAVALARMSGLQRRDALDRRGADSID